MSNVLEEIVTHQRTVVEAAKRAVPTEELADRLGDAPPVRDFAAALANAAGGMGLIAEVKRLRPRRGSFGPTSTPSASPRPTPPAGRVASAC